MSRHRHLKPAPQGGPMNRHDHRLGRVLNELQQRIQISRGLSPATILANSRISAPAINVLPPPIMTIARTAASASARSMPSRSPSGTPGDNAFTRRILNRQYRHAVLNGVLHQIAHGSPFLTRNRWAPAPLLSPLNPSGSVTGSTDMTQNSGDGPSAIRRCNRHTPVCSSSFHFSRKSE